MVSRRRTRLNKHRPFSPDRSRRVLLAPVTAALLLLAVALLGYFNSPQVARIMDGQSGLLFAGLAGAAGTMVFQFQQTRFNDEQKWRTDRNAARESLWKWLEETHSQNASRLPWLALRETVCEDPELAPQVLARVEEVLESQAETSTRKAETENGQYTAPIKDRRAQQPRPEIVPDTRHFPRQRREPWLTGLAALQACSRSRLEVSYSPGAEHTLDLGVPESTLCLIDETNASLSRMRLGMGSQHRFIVEAIGGSQVRNNLQLPDFIEGALIFEFPSQSHLQWIDGEILRDSILYVRLTGPHCNLLIERAHIHGLLAVAIFDQSTITIKATDLGSTGQVILFNPSDPRTRGVAVNLEEVTVAAERANPPVVFNVPTPLENLLASESRSPTFESTLDSSTIAIDLRCEGTPALNLATSVHFDFSGLALHNCSANIRLTHFETLHTEALQLLHGSAINVETDATDVDFTETRVAGNRSRRAKISLKSTAPENPSISMRSLDIEKGCISLHGAHARRPPPTSVRTLFAASLTSLARDSILECDLPATTLSVSAQDSSEPLQGFQIFVPDPENHHKVPPGAQVLELTRSLK